MEKYSLSPIFNSAVSSAIYFEKEYQPRSSCCEKSNLCYLYLRVRPPTTCRRYFPPFWFWFFGDPHIKTLDGVEYTFNGYGEYTLALVEDDNGQRLFELQGRTQRATDTETGQLTDATFYSGFAAEYVGDGRIEVKLNEDATDLVTRVNGQLVERASEDVMIGNVTVRWEEDPIQVVASFPSDIQLTVGVNNSIGDITVQFGQEYRNNTKGLLGVWDGDPSNDALRRDGTLQPATGTNGEMLEKDFFAFGESWRITEENSLFYYQNGESWALANNLTFTPQFLEDLIAKADPAKLEKARATCGDSNMCLYDTLATNDETIGKATMTLNMMNTANEKAATNYPPNITDVESINVKVGEEFTLQVEAVDPDGDSIAYMLLQSVPGASVTQEGLFTWIPVDKSKVALGILVTDGQANATLEPVVNLCDCMNNGTCLYDEYATGTNIVADSFGVVLCDCLPGWSGEFCEVNFDACADDPCFLGVVCTDEDPPSFNSTCGPCPEGMEGDGKTCLDIDECVKYRDEPASNGGRGCDQICTNLLQSYNCSCNEGYSLYLDGRQCIDIDECNLQRDNCAEEATCNNTQGSYECNCNQGYVDIAGDGTICQDIDECSSADTNECDNNSVCTNTKGSYRCVCNEGYEGSGTTCTDVDECARDTDDCHAEASCTNSIGSYNCTCNDGWTGDGRSCDDENECMRQPAVCHTNASCSDTIGSFMCQCKDGYTGDGSTCEDIDECTLNVDGCSQDCMNNEGSFECVCFEQFTKDANGICVANNPCTAENIEACANGMCYSDGTSPVCACSDGYTEVTSFNCQDVDECTGAHGCMSNSICNNTLGGYECVCNDGFTLNNDQRSCSDIDECSLPIDNPSFAGCHHQAQCINLDGSFQCNCSMGYKGNGTHCENIDECADGNTVCASNSTCQDTDGSYRCICNDGYRGDGSVSCENINECQENPDICHSLAACMDTDGAYQCDCRQGYQGNDTYCEDQNECDSGNNCAATASCMNTIGSYTCTCNTGYVSVVGSVEGRQCEDIDECALSLDSCDASVSQCNNTDGNYTCVCLDGYEKNNMDQCEDIDECSDTSRCSSKANSECQNLPGTHECNCMIGYFEENSQCSVAVSYNASAVFEIINGLIVGGLGYDLNADYFTYRTALKTAIEDAFSGSSLSSSFRDVIISDITPLTDSTALVKVIVNFQTNQVESAIIQAFLSQLTGSSGGQLAPNHKLVRKTFIIGDPKCTTTPCTNGGECSEDNSLAEGFSCSCLPGFSGQTCDIRPCTTNPCLNNGACAENTTSETGYICSCNPGYTGPLCATAVPCEGSHECQNGAACNNDQTSPRGYTCTCLMGFTGQNCQTVITTTDEPPTPDTTAAPEPTTPDATAASESPTPQRTAAPVLTTAAVTAAPGTPTSASEETTTKEITTVVATTAGCTMTASDCPFEKVLDEGTCQCVCPTGKSGTNCEVCSLSTSSCVIPQEFSAAACECVCPETHSGPNCTANNPCLSNSTLCPQTEVCVPALTAAGYACECRTSQGFARNGNGPCTSRPFFRGVIPIPSLTFTQALLNRISAAFRNLAAKLEEAIKNKLRNHPATRNVIAVVIIRFSSGSVVTDFVATFPESQAVPSDSDVQQAFSDNTLTVGGTPVPIEPITVGVSVSTEMPSTEDLSTRRTSPGTTATSTPSPDVTLATVLIIVSSIVFILVVVVIVFCICLIMRRRYEASLAYSGRGGHPRVRKYDYDMDDYNRRSRFADDDGYGTGDYPDEERRMNRLRSVISQSPYLQPVLPGRHSSFMRPYLATGMEAAHHERSPRADRGDSAGLVVYNPVAYLQ